MGAKTAGALPAVVGFAGIARSCRTLARISHQADMQIVTMY
jgi:hypothetical protein